MCVCVRASLNVIRCNSSPLHLQRVGKRGQTKKERKKERKKVKLLYLVVADRTRLHGMVIYQYDLNVIRVLVNTYCV